MNRETVRKTYSDLVDSYKLVLQGLKKKSLLISLLRLLVFIGGVIITVFTFSYSTAGGVLVIFITLFFFLFLVKLFAGYSGRIIITENLIRINNNEIKGLDGDYSAFDGGTGWIDSNHDFSNDIDLFGEASLFSYLNRTVTGTGKRMLAEWLSDPYDLREQIKERQEAIRELSGKLGWRQEFMACSIDKPLDEKEMESLEVWLNEDRNFFSAPVLVLVTYILPVVTISLLLLVIAALLPVMAFIPVFIFNLSLVGIYLKRTNRIHSLVTGKHIFLSSLEQLVNSFENEKFHSAVLRSAGEKIYLGEGSAAVRIKELSKIIRLFDSRLNMMAGLILNGLILWDFQCIRRLERWKTSVSSSLPSLLNLLGEVDALNSLANYTYNNPDHSFPEIIHDSQVLEAVRMGHPLLERKTRVDNDFSVGSRGRVFIVTGANMSGKSTFLRTVAENMVLAMTGAPVCAGEMKFSPVKLFTSMRTTDSLSRNESYFYAELKRLKTLKERLETGENIFFILDEIFKGTNSSDKSFGSKMFLKRLIELGGTGIIATHDISLGDMEKEFPGNVINKCFEIEIDGQKISFDYILRDGITRKMNAVILMKQMGIA
jgi:hypothetical protein